MSLKSKIIDYLLLKNNLQTYDEDLVNKLVYCFNLQNRLRKDIKANGEIIIEKGQTKINPAVDLYLKLDKNIKDYFVKLGITTQERLKLKIEEAKKQ